MGYEDEKTAELKLERRREQHTDIRKGVYIDSQLVTFSPRKLWDDIEIFIPDDFIEMPEDELANSEWNGFTGLEHTNMDYFNNAIGRESLQLYELNTTQPEISDRILEKLKKGEMVYLVDDKRYDKLLECESAE